MIRQDASLEKQIVLAIAAVGLLLRIIVVFNSATFCTLVDDTFYSLDIARNIASGKGITIGGVLTNGFQPLHVFLCVPFYMVLPDILALKSILVLLAVVNSATGILIFVLLRRMGFAYAGVVGATLWSISPYVLSRGMNGLETPLAPFMLLVSLLYYLYAVHCKAVVAVRSWLLLGVILGIAVLARIDMGFWAAAMAFGILISEKTLSLSARMKGLACTVVAALVVALPWFAYNVIIFGSPLPGSGQAVRFISLAYGYNHWGTRGEHLLEFHVPFRYYALSLMSSVKEVFASFDIISTLFTFRGQCFLWLMVLLLARKSLMRIAREYPALLAFPACMVSVYSFWIFGQWFYDRYYYSVHLDVIILVSMVLGIHGESFLSKRKNIIRVVVVVACLLGVLAWNALPQIAIRNAFRESVADKRNNDAVQTADVTNDLVKANVPAGEKVGAFQSGALGYYCCDHIVVNLDGVVNQKALRAMKENRMAAYLQEQGINWMVDWDWIIDALYVRRSGITNALAEWELVARQGSRCLYRRKSAAPMSK